MKKIGRTINEYFFVTCCDNFVGPNRVVILDPSNNDGISVAVVGKFEDGENWWATSPVVRIDGDTVETQNSIYTLGSPHTDYVEMARAKKVKIPVIRNWYFDAENGKVILHGEDLNGKILKGAVVGQDKSGNYLLVKDGDDSPKRIFLCWPDALDNGVYQAAYTKAFACIDGVERAFGHKVRLRFKAPYTEFYERYMVESENTFYDSNMSNLKDLGEVILNFFGIEWFEALCDIAEQQND